MIWLNILVAQIIILMPRMIARICKNMLERKEDKMRPPATPLRGVVEHRGMASELLLVFLYISAIFLFIRMIIWATRVKSSIILNHPRLRQKPVCLQARGWIVEV